MPIDLRRNRASHPGCDGTCRQALPADHPIRSRVAIPAPRCPMPADLKRRLQEAKERVAAQELALAAP